jgi:hypothetical protein
MTSVRSVFKAMRHHSFALGAQFGSACTNDDSFGLFAIAKALFATAFAPCVVGRRKHIHHTQHPP